MYGHYTKVLIYKALRPEDFRNAKISGIWGLEVDEWQRYTVDLGENGTTEVEARETGSGAVEWRGMAGTTFESWVGGEPRKPSQTVAEQVQNAAYDWFQRTRMN